MEHINFMGRFDADGSQVGSRFGPMIAAKRRQIQCMPKIACNNGSHEPASAPPTVLEIVTALTELQQQQLRDFARKRIRRLSRSPGLARFLTSQTPEDLVNSALEKLLLGKVHPQTERQS